MSKKSDMPYISDPKLIPRIKSFLQTKRPDTVVHEDSVVQHLQAIYREYARKKKNAFALTVSKALHLAKVELYGDDADSFGKKGIRSESSSSSDTEDLVAYENTNHMNLMMRNLYRQSSEAKAAKEAETSEPEQTPKKRKIKSTTSVCTPENKDKNGSWTLDYGNGKKLGGETRHEAAAAATPFHSSLGQSSVRPLDHLAESAKLLFHLLNNQKETAAAGLGSSISNGVPISNCTCECTCGARQPKTKNREMSDASESSDKRSSTSVQNKRGKRKREREPETDSNFSDVMVEHPTTTLKDFAGYEKLLKELYPDIKIFLNYTTHGVLSCKPPGGYILHGPDRSGRRFLVKCIAGEFKLPLMMSNVNNLKSDTPGKSVKWINELFQEAKSLAPCVLFLDEIDCLATKQDSQNSTMDQIVRKLGEVIDDLSSSPEHVLLIGATNSISSVDKELRTPERFQEIGMGVPDLSTRESILEKLCCKIKISPDFSLKSLAKATPGFVRDDLSNLVFKAQKYPALRVMQYHETQSCENEMLSENMEKKSSEEEEMLKLVTEADFMKALQNVQPTAKREGFATMPSTTWDDVGALGNVRLQLEKAILRRVNDPGSAAAFKLPCYSGIILYGPPGCGKTLVGKALANEAGLNFMYIQGPELRDKFVGESERKLREVFDKAQACAPCLIFFDEIDGLFMNRANSEGNSVGHSLTNQLLVLTDGCAERNQVYVMGATNMIELIDPALLRQGRFDSKIFIGLPSEAGRLDILKVQLKSDDRRKLVDCDLQEIARKTEGFSGADLTGLLHKASEIVWDENLKDESWRNCPEKSREYILRGEHIAAALELVKPSVSQKNAMK